MFDFRIYSIIDRFLSVGDKSRDSAAILASNFFSRPDVSIELLPKFMKGSLERISDLTATPTPSHMQTHLGSVIAVARLLKLADRKDMIKYAPNIIETGVKLDTCGHELVAKLKVKLIGRAALSLMPPRLAKWRYKRGRRLLAENLVANKEQANDTKELVSKIHFCTMNYCHKKLNGFNFIIRMIVKWRKKKKKITTSQMKLS